MSLVMPPPDAATLARRAEIVAAMRTIVPGEGVIDELEALRPYESDALTAYAQIPLLVVLPETVEQVASVLRWCHANRVKVVPRRAGTSLSGGALPLAPGHAGHQVGGTTAQAHALQDLADAGADQPLRQAQDFQRQRHVLPQ